MTKEVGLDDVLWGVLGGNPVQYQRILSILKIGPAREKENRQDGIARPLCNVIYNAIKLVQDCQADHSGMRDIISLFKEEASGHLKEKSFQNKMLQRPSSDEVFRSVEREDLPVLVPASNAIGIVLHHNLTKKPKVEELETMIK